MSRLTLGGRKRAGGKVHKHRRQSEEEHENVVTQREDLLRTVDESHDRSSCAPKYTYHLKYLTVSRIFFRKRTFTPVSCCKCGTEFGREKLLYEHLEMDERCMSAMGGSVEEAKRYVRNMKDQSRNQADKDSQKQRFKVYHQGNKQTVNKKRMDRFENNKETEKANFKAYHEANKEPRQKYFATYHENNKESRQKDFAARYEANKAKSGRYGPIFPCIVCHELHWWSNVDVVNFDDVEDKFLCNEYIVSRNNLFMKLDSYYCCKTCKKKTDGGEMPRVAAVNDMKCPWENTPQFMLKSKVNMVISKCFITIVFSVGS